jgi:hypothetical protein
MRANGIPADVPKTGVQRDENALLGATDLEDAIIRLSAKALVGHGCALEAGVAQDRGCA